MSRSHIPQVATAGSHSVATAALSIESLSTVPLSNESGQVPPLRPGAVIGILGGGQLGRMTALAAANLGYSSHIFCPDGDCPAMQVTNLATVANYGDHEALRDFAAKVDVVTYEFENIDLDTVLLIESVFNTRVSASGKDCAKDSANAPGKDNANDGAPRKAVYPSSFILKTSQNRVFEKQFINAQGIDTVAWQPISSQEQLLRAFTELGGTIVLKTSMLGYDGKGQVKITSLNAIDKTWEEFTQTHKKRDDDSNETMAAPYIVEKFDPFIAEGSVIIARDQSGKCESYELVENQHHSHILSYTIAAGATGKFSHATRQRAQEIAKTLAEKLDLVGLLAVEFFIRADGSLAVNELAPRPHNSGHWTMDGSRTSQFEQLVRAICGLPLGSPERLFPRVEMENLIGDQVLDWPGKLTEQPNAKLHLYGKTEAKPGRKMGHVNRIFLSE